MKKAVGIGSLIIITIAFLFAGVKMTELSPSINGIGQVIVDNTLEKTGAINSVTSIVFDFRGYDTLGESFVLFTAVCGVTAVLRTRKKGKEETKYEKE